MQPQVAQSAPQDCPRCPTETSKVPQRETKGAQCGPQSMPWHSKVRSKESYIHQNSRSTAPAATMLTVPKTNTQSWCAERASSGGICHTFINALSWKSKIKNTVRGDLGVKLWGVFLDFPHFRWRVISPRIMQSNAIIIQ